MKTENHILTKQAREALKGKWPEAIMTFLLSALLGIATTSIPKGSSLVSLIISGPLALGLAIFSLSISRNQNAKIEQLFWGFKRFQVSLFAYLLMALFVLLWSLLLIIPGIVAAISYAMTFYLLADDPALKPKEALDKSKKMMYGYKWKFFMLQLRFLGWALLCILTLGIGFLWLMPYQQISNAKFYEDLKKDSTPEPVKVLV